MSRKREKQRAARRELDRQLEQAGVDDSALAEQLRAQPRVCEPEFDVRLSVERARRGLFRFAKPLAVHVALFVVDSGGPRRVRFRALRGEARQVPGDVRLDVVHEQGEQRIRYARPGHFIAVILVLEGGPPLAADDAVGPTLAALADPARVRIDLGSGGVGVGELAPASLEAGRHATILLDAEDPVARADVTMGAASVVAIPAVHKVRTEVALPIASVNDRLRATAMLSIKL